MRQSLRPLMSWVLAGVLAGLAAGATADATGAFGFLQTGEIAKAGDFGFLDVNGTFSPIHVAGASSTLPLGINNAGQIVGTFVDSAGTHGFLKVGGTFSTIDVPGASSTEARGINDAGHIVGDFVGGLAIPEPASIVLFSVGLLGLGLAWRRKLN